MRAFSLSLAAAACVAVVPRANAQSAPPAAAAPTGFATVTGVVVDSLHDAPLAKANVFIDGTSRVGLTDGNGRYTIDSVPAGQHRVLVMHPLLDTIGITLRTPDLDFPAGQVKQLDISIPGPAFIASRVCTPAQRNLGPAALLGFVKDPDTHEPMIGAKVELVFDVTDLIGRKTPRVRSAVTDSAGMYRICGIPGDMNGKVQVFRNGISSGEVPAEVTNGFLALRAFSIVAEHQAVVEVKGDSGKVVRVAKGTAKLSGRVTNKKGEPLRDARVALQGGAAPVLTDANGRFSLDSLPSGTQSVEVRKLGYSVQQVAVELSSNTPSTTNVLMDDAAPLLETMRVEAASDQALSELGYTSRKRSGFGYYLDGKQINHDALVFSDVMRSVPGLRISPAGNGRDYVITDSRNQAGGCVVYYVDGIEWQTMTPGDIDQYVRPGEMVAVEVYHGSSTPPQFQKPGSSDCASIVVWTQARVNTMTKKAAKKP